MSNNKYDKRKIKNILYVHLYCLCMLKNMLNIHVKILYI